jgi:hypothetical protein
MTAQVFVLGLEDVKNFWVQFRLALQIALSFTHGEMSPAGAVRFPLANNSF